MAKDLTAEAVDGSGLLIFALGIVPGACPRMGVTSSAGFEINKAGCSAGFVSFFFAVPRLGLGIGAISVSRVAGLVGALGRGILSTYSVKRANGHCTRLS